MSRTRRRLDPLRVVALLVLLGGLAAAGWWAWQNVGTSWVADRQEAAALSAFDDEHPRTDGVGELRTDLGSAPAAPGPSGTPGQSGAWATLWVPSWAGTHGVHGDVLDARTPIKEGVTQAVLATGAAGRFTQTEGPGEVGNMALAGHRRTYGDNFLHVDDLVPGDAVVVETPDAWYVYEVTVKPYLVLPAAGAEVTADAPAGLPDGGRYLTLVSCHSVTDGEWGNDHRIVVHASMTGWLPRADGVPPELADVVARGG